MWLELAVVDSLSDGFEVQLWDLQLLYLLSEVEKCLHKLLRVVHQL
jgi:hypothetical protein